MKDLESDRPIIAIAGPTASGKTALAVAAALEFGAEIVNFDSVQIYKGIEIATAKPTAAERKGVPHHLIDYVEPHINYTAADWASDAAGKIAEIEARSKMVILVGGTGFYLRTLRQPLFEAPSTDAQLRERFKTIGQRRGLEHLHRMLTRVDPELAESVPPRDHIRVTRGLEYYFQTGERLSERQLQRPSPPDFARRIRVFVLDPPRDELYRRINERTDELFAAGLVEEVISLRSAGLRDDTNALGAHAYRRVCEYLRGERDLASAIERSKQDVRNYAKRQLTWFRKEPGVQWLPGFGHGDEPLTRLIAILAAISGPKHKFI